MGVLPNELVDVHVTTSNSDENGLTLFNLDIDSFLSKLIDTFRLSQEHDVHFFSFWILVQVISQSLINLAILLCDVNGLIFFQSLIEIKNFPDLVLEKLISIFHILELFEELKLNIFGLVDLLFNGNDSVIELPDIELECFSNFL